MINKILWFVKISFIIFSIFFFIKIDFSKLNFFGQNQIIAVLLLIIFHSFRILRLYFIFYFMNIRIKFRNLIDIYYIGLYLGIVTPGRLGEFYRIKLINDLNIPKLSNYNFILIEKITDIFSIFIFTIFFLVNVNYVFDFKIIFLLLIFVFINIIFINYFYKVLIYFIKKISITFPKIKKIKNIELFYKNNPFEYLGNKKALFLFILTIIIWLLFIFAVQIGIIGSFKINFIDVIELFVINTIVSALPITIMGLGLREIVLVEFFDLENLLLVAQISFQFIFFNLITIIPGIVLFLKKEYKII